MDQILSLLQSANPDLFSSMPEVSLALECEHEPDRALGKSEDVWLLVFRFVTPEETSHGRYRDHHAATILHLPKKGIYPSQVCKETSSKKIPMFL